MHIPKCFVHNGTQALVPLQACTHHAHVPLLMYSLLFSCYNGLGPLVFPSSTQALVLREEQSQHLVEILVGTAIRGEARPNVGSAVAMPKDMAGSLLLSEPQPPPEHSGFELKRTGATVSQQE